MENYEKKELLGRGGFAKVYLVTERSTGKEYAMKIIDISGVEPEKYEHEISLLQGISKLSHPNIVKYHTNFIDSVKKKCIIIMEYCKGTLHNKLGGDLATFIEKYQSKNIKIPEEKIQDLLIDILLGLQYIHENKIIHWDLKPQNILLDENLSAKIADFGIAKNINEKRLRSQSFMGTYLYMSPEVLKGDKFELNTDIWSLGCIMHELCCFSVMYNILQVPYNKDNYYTQIETIDKTEYNPYVLPKEYSKELKDIIALMITKDPLLRPNCAHILGNKYILLALSKKFINESK